MVNFRKSLSSKLCLGILLMAVPIFVLSLGLLFQKSRNYVRQDAMERANSVLNTMMLRIKRHVGAVETATNANEWLITQYLQPDSLLALTNRIVRLNPHVDGCSISTEPDVFPQYGRHFSAYTIKENDSIITVVEQEYEYFDRIWYKTPREQGPCWVVFSDDTDSLEVTLDGMIASYVKPIYKDDGSFIGVISTDLSLGNLTGVIASEHPYPNSYFMMIGKDGHYYIHPDRTKLFKKTIFSGTDPRRNADIIALGHEMTAGKQGNMRVFFDGVPCLVCYRPMPGTPWSLALVCPDSDILNSYHQLAYIIISLLVIGLLVIMLLCRRAVANAINPLNQLLEQTQNIASGNYEVHIPRSQRKDVVGRLQNSFAKMLQSLNFHMGIIRYTADQARLRNEELVKAAKMAEESVVQKTAFIQNMTHQIRTPLNIIMGFSQVLRDSGGQLPEEELKSITSMMGHNANALNRMVLMLFDSSDSGLTEELNCQKHELVNCNQLARESIEHTNAQFPGLTINFETDLSDDFHIHTNRIYLMRSLREILYNSAKYSDGKHVLLRVTQTETTVRFIFEDTGPGMAEDYLDLMFKPFTKANDLSEGLGLGLPLAKRHAINLGGDLTIDLDYQHGCRFVIEIPNT